LPVLSTAAPAFSVAGALSALSAAEVAFSLATLTSVAAAFSTAVSLAAVLSAGLLHAARPSARTRAVTATFFMIVPLPSMIPVGGHRSRPAAKWPGQARGHSCNPYHRTRDYFSTRIDDIKISL